MARMRHLYTFYHLSPFAGEPGKHHDRREHKSQVVSDWLNPNSLGIMSAFSCIENLGLNSTCLIDYQEITR